ncbi:hypothetical protein, partial [Escherichia coli]|uniref:hypothetical protein n=1 Tax=Escherichia coli TaxID=562 RepID=UPI001F4A455C
MMKTITKQPILFTDVPVADLRNSMKHDLNQNLIERLWNLSRIHIAQPTRPAQLAYAVICLKKKTVGGGGGGGGGGG